MRGFVLAAGFGTRLKPLTEHLPKALVPVGGRPLLCHSLEAFKISGIDKIGVNSHYLHDQMIAFQQNSAVPFELVHEKNRIRGTGGAFDAARPFLSQEDRFCVLNVDIINRIDLKALAAQFAGTDCAAALVASPAADKGTILYNKENGNYLGVIAEKERFTRASIADFTGITFYRRDFLDLVTSDDFSVTAIWSRAVERGMHIKVIILDNVYWVDAGTPGNLAKVHFDLIDGTIDLTVAGELEIDRQRKICTPKMMSAEQKRKIGTYAWIENEALPDGAQVISSIIFKGAPVTPASSYFKKLVTIWGEIPF